MYNSGDLDQPIVIKRRTVVPDTQGGYTETFVDTSAWAKVTPMSGSEAERFDHVTDAQTYKMVIRSEVDVNELDTIDWISTLLNVRRVEILPRSSFKVLIAEVGVAT